MGSRLGSLLIQQGSLTVEQLRDAFTAQVIAGGSLDTALLERGLVDEPTLLEILGQVSGCPPMPPDLMDGLSTELAQQIDNETAERLCICPVRRVDDRLLLLSGEGTDRVGLEELSYELGCRVEAYAATELRVHQAAAEVYRRPLDPRFERLLDRHGLRPPQAQSVPREQANVSLEDTYRAAQAEQAPPVGAVSASTDEVRQAPAGRVGRETAPFGSDASARAATEAAAAAAAAVAEPSKAAPERKPRKRRAKTDPYPAMVQDRRAAARGIPRPPRSTGSQHPHEILAITLVEALQVLPGSSNRDELLMGILRCAHSYLDTVHLYVVKRNVLVGRYAVDNGRLDRSEVRARRISLEVPSVVARAVRDAAIYVGVSPDTDASATVLLTAEILAPNIVLVPICVKQRTVCILLGHDRGQAPPSVRAPLSELSAAASAALSTMIVRGKMQRQPAEPEPAPAPEPSKSERAPRAKPIRSVMGLAHSTSGEFTAPPSSAIPSASDQKVIVTFDVNVGAPRAPATAAATERDEHDEGEEPFDDFLREEDTAVDRPHLLAIERASDATAGDSADDAVAKAADDDATELRELLERLAGDDDASADALERIKELGAAAATALAADFPGEISVDYPPPAATPPSACGPTLKALAAIGEPALEALTPLLTSDEARVRFFATHLLSEIVTPGTLGLVVGRLSDDSREVRRIATKALRAFRHLDRFGDVLEDLRADLSHRQSKQRRWAMESLALLGDVVSTPSIVAMLRDTDADIADSAHRALVNLTKQDFGGHTKSWISWWERNRGRHRIEWLIDGLVHEQPHIRADAAGELTELTGITFGYKYDLPEKDRDEIRMRFLVWWADTGLLDFGRLQ